MRYMKDNEIKITQDYFFAGTIDAFCNTCQDGCSNVGQLQNLLDRKKAYPQEGNVLTAVQKQCTWCFDNGKPFTDSLTARFSCAWRCDWKTLGNPDILNT